MRLVSQVVTAEREEVRYEAGALVRVGAVESGLGDSGQLERRVRRRARVGSGAVLASS